MSERLEKSDIALDDHSNLFDNSVFNNQLDDDDDYSIVDTDGIVEFQDNYNDEDNVLYNHLSDVANLYSDSPEICKISAIIELKKENLKAVLKSKLQFTDAQADDNLKEFQISKLYNFSITRKMEYIENKLSMTYELSPKLNFKNSLHENEFCEGSIHKLPYILYFDEFRERFPDLIEINYEEEKSKWLDILEELFIKTNENYSVYKLKDLEERRRKSILSAVKRKLNETLTKQWANFRLENKESLEIDIDFITENKIVKVIQSVNDQNGRQIEKKTTQEVEKYYLKFDVVEIDAKGDEHYFYVRDRSKGFYWFFNFVMKLEFNPDVAGDYNNAIYLLDEPGSYLHPFALSKLCKKLKSLSENNIVIYCTHSHYLLNPEIIPINKVNVVSKNSLGQVQLEPYYQHKSTRTKSINTAFQTIHDALYIKPFDLDLNHRKIIIVEGIYDYYAFSLFKISDNIGILPGKGADSLIQFISLMIAFEIEFRVLWDNDKEGNLGKEKAESYFGTEISQKHFFTLIAGKRILQDVFEGSDLKQLRIQLKLDDSTSFERVITSLFYHKNKQSLVHSISQKTKDNFSNIFKHVGF